jgi:hypothetical protein
MIGWSLGSWVAKQIKAKIFAEFLLPSVKARGGGGDECRTQSLRWAVDWTTNPNASEYRWKLRYAYPSLAGLTSMLSISASRVPALASSSRAW